MGSVWYDDENANVTDKNRNVYQYMDKTKTKHLLLKLLVGYMILVGGIYLIGYRQFHWRESKTKMVSATGNTGELTAGHTASQFISAPAERIIGAELRFGTYDRKNSELLSFS